MIKDDIKFLIDKGDVNSLIMAKTLLEAAIVWQKEMK